VADERRAARAAGDAAVESVRQQPELELDQPVRYCGRDFTPAEIVAIQGILVEDPDRSRFAISKLVCERLEWRKPNGELKDMSCRVAMLRMQDDGLIILPPPKQQHPNNIPFTRRSPDTQPGLPIEGEVSELRDLRLEIVDGKQASRLWNEYVDRYHYLGYTKLPGAQLRYLARACGQVVAALGFAASAWKTAPRDEFIGWSHKQRKRNLQLVVNNARFLILPWVRCRNLASKLLGMAARRLPDDWDRRYAYRPVLLETFVEVERFEGTSYKAANWIHVGETQGRGKLDRYEQYNEPVRSIWLYPLTEDFRQILCR